MVRSPTARRLLVSSLLSGLAANLFVVAAIANDEHAGRSAGSPRVLEGGTLRIGARTLDFIDPALTQSFNTGTTVGLVSQGLEDATCALLLLAIPFPVLRSSVTNSCGGGDRLPPRSAPDGKTYTFTSRSGYRFSTGAPVTAANYAAAINRNLNPVLHSPAAQYLQDVIGADAVQQEQRKPRRRQGCRNRLIVRLKCACPIFPRG